MDGRPMDGKELQELIDRMALAHGDMTAFLAKSKDVAATDDQRKQARSMFELKTSEFDNISTEVEDLKVAVVAGKALADAQLLVKTPEVKKGMNLNPDDDPGGKAKKDGLQGKVQVIESIEGLELAMKGLFLNWAANGPEALDSMALGAISVRNHPSSRMQELEGKNLVIMPPSMARNIFAPFGSRMLLGNPYGEVGGKVVIPAGSITCDAQGKTMLSTDLTGGGTDSGAGDLFPATAFITELLEEPLHDAALFDKTKRVPAGNGKATWPLVDKTQGPNAGMVFTWKSTEGADKGETEPTFGQWDVSTTELSGWTALSMIAIARSQIPLEAFITALARQAVRYEFSRKILLGTGSNQPQGIVDATDTVVVNRAVGNQIAWADIINMEYGVKKGFRAGAQFILADNGEKYCKGLLDTTGRPLFTADMAGAIKNNFASYPYDVQDYLDESNSALLDLGTAGDLIFGNLQHYGFGVEADIAIARSEHADFKKGLIVFRIMCFAGGKPIYGTAFSQLDDAAS